MRQMRRMILAAAGSLAVSMPLACAQTPAPGTPSATQGSVSPDQARKAGHAMKQVIAIQKQYRGHLNSAAPSQQQNAERQQVVNAEVKAIHNQGLSLAQYSQAITAARTDPKVRQEVLEAANLGQQ